MTYTNDLYYDFRFFKERHLVKLGGLASGAKSDKDKVEAATAEVHPKLRSLGGYLKGLQGKTEKAVSDLYKGRPVHLVGDINRL
jgi:hypothetical protein